MGDRTNLYVLVEGQTEENVFREMLRPYLAQCGIDAQYHLIKTSTPAGRAAFRGGVSSWAKIAGELRKLLAHSNIDVLTTMFGYSGFPADAPGMSDRPHASPLDRVRHVEARLASEIGNRRFVPHLVMHEMEAWVVAAADQLAELRGDPRLATKLHRVSRAAGGPELIDDGPTTAPSKRIQRICPDYDKVFDGPLALADLGVGPLRARCPHADEWLRQLGV